MVEKKRTVCDGNRESFDKWESFVSGILLLNMLNSNVKKWKKHKFDKIF